MLVASQASSRNATSLTADQIAVYRAFLVSYSDGSEGTLNLASSIRPLELSRGEHASGCLKGIASRGITSKHTASHTLSADVVSGIKIHLVDPQKQFDVIKLNDPGDKIRRGAPVEDAVKSAFDSGMLEISEIAFDKRHWYAVLNYSFPCGRLCGHGGTVVFERVNGVWKRTERSCGGWVS